MISPRVLALAWILPLSATAWVVSRAEAAVAFAGELAVDTAILALPQLAVAVISIQVARRAPKLGWGLLWLPALAALGWASVLPAAIPPVAPAGGPDIVLITLDTFRADYLGVAGGPVPTPHLDALAAEGIRFTDAVSTAPLTAPAHASMLTGLSTPEHGLRQNGQRLTTGSVIPKLRAAGWRTGAFLSSLILDRETGLNDGFDRYEDRWGWRGRMSWLGPAVALLSRGVGERRGDQAVDRALRWLAETPGPRLCWIHLFDAHLPYMPPPEWMPDPGAMRDSARLAKAAGRESGGVREWIADIDRRQAPGQRLLYGAEVRWVDELVGRVLTGVPPNAVVIVAGDHGESLGEHGYYFNHGANLHEPSLRVPLILRWPDRVTAGSVSDKLVSVQNIAGTLLAAAGLGSGLPSLVAPGPERVEQYSSGQQARARDGASSAAVRRPDEKVIAAADGTAVWYDLTVDPGELAPVPAPESRAEDARRAAALAAEPLPALSEEMARQLEALGYVGGRYTIAQPR